MRRLLRGLMFVLVLFASGMSFVWWAERQSDMHNNDSGGGLAVPDLGDGSARMTSALRALDNLASLSYVRGTFDPDSHLRGVVTHDASRAFSGFNFYNSRSRESAFLIDMTGRVIHEWNHDTVNVLESAELLPNGDVLVIESSGGVWWVEPPGGYGMPDPPRGGVVRLDSQSRLLWKFKGRVHHDLDVFDNRIYVLSLVHTRRPEVHGEGTIIDDMLLILTPDGVEIERISILDVLLDSPYAYVVRNALAQGPRHRIHANGHVVTEVLHSNHVEVIPEGFESRSPAFKPGNIILSMRDIHTVMVVDPVTHEIVWLWGPGNLTYQHHPSLLANGNLLIFDNRLKPIGSRVLELDPVSLQIVWSYAADDFFSNTRGSVQRLPNGNTLITESNTGYVFEVDESGRTVWEFANPVLIGDKRDAIWRMTRFSSGDLPFLPVSQAMRGGTVSVPASP